MAGGQLEFAHVVAEFAKSNGLLGPLDRAFGILLPLKDRYYRSPGEVVVDCRVVVGLGEVSRAWGRLVGLGEVSRSLPVVRGFTNS